MITCLGRQGFYVGDNDYNDGGDEGDEGDGGGEGDVALFDMPNLNRFDIL